MRTYENNAGRKSFCGSSSIKFYKMNERILTVFTLARRLKNDIYAQITLQLTRLSLIQITYFRNQY